MKRPQPSRERSSTNDEWAGWFEDLGEIVKDEGVAFTGSAHHVSLDRTFNDRFDGTTGYLIIEAGSIAEAVALAQGCPALEQGTRITVFDTLQSHETSGSPG